jgi:glucokinase
VTTPAVEIGGSHVSAALVDASGTVGPILRASLDRNADAATLLDTITAVASRICAGPGSAWGIAIPGPFDYDAGIGRYQSVGKFESLNGIDVGAALKAGVRPSPSSVHFTGDAIAFALGEWASGPARGRARIAALTLGTGIGSAFLIDGRPVTTGPAVPPEGRADLLTKDGQGLEELVSGRAVLDAYQRLNGEPAPSVAELAQRAQTGDQLAGRVLGGSYRTLGDVLAPYIDAFQPEILVVGGGISAAWPLIEPSLRAGLRNDCVSIVQSADTEVSALRGAAREVETLSGHGRVGS